MAPTLARSAETGAILGALTVGLAATGILLSPTLGGPRGNANLLYVSHLAMAALFAAFMVWHFVPIVRRLFTRVDSVTLIALALVEIATGYVLWAHDYRIIPKQVAVGVHLVATALLAVPIATHSVRGTRLWLRQRAKPEARIDRRVFLRVAAYAVAGLALASAFGRAASDEVKSWRLNSIGATPRLTKGSWTLKVTGLVNKPIELSFEELMAMPSRTERMVHHCVEGWTYEDEFTGVPLREVLARAGGLKQGARMLVFKSPEVSSNPRTFGRRYSTNFPVQERAIDRSLVVFAVGGEDLPAEHGFPVRLMTPTKWGYKACKWLTEVEVIDDAAYRGYWERAGYHNTGDYPGPIFG